MVKASNYEIDRRITEIYKLLLGGATYRQILQHCKVQWNVRDSMANKYIARARECYVAYSPDDREVERNKALTRYNKLYLEAEQLNEEKRAKIEEIMIILTREIENTKKNGKIADMLPILECIEVISRRNNKDIIEILKRIDIILGLEAPYKIEHNLIDKLKIDELRKAFDCVSQITNTDNSSISM